MATPEFVPSALLWAVLSLPVIALAGHLALEWAEFAASGLPRDRLLGPLGAGLCLGTGLWTVHAASGAASLAAAIAGFGPGAEFALWAVAVVAGVAVSSWAAGKHAALPWMLANGIGLGSALLLLLMLGVSGAAWPGGIDWHAGPLLLAWLGLALAGAAALAQHRLLRHSARRWVVTGRIASATALAAALLAGQHLILVAARLPAPDAAGGAAALSAALALLAGLQLFKGRISRAGSARAMAQRELAAQASNDPLTGLPHRTLFEGTLAQAVRQADASVRRLALLLINLDGFRPVNQALGYRGGDRVLCEVAARLRRLSAPHMAARLAGDEFLLLLASDPRPEQASAHAAEVLAAIGRPIVIDGRETQLSCSIGVAMYPEHGAMSALLAHAEAAMRSAKAAGGASHAFFEPRMLNGSRDQVDLLRDLRLALQRGQLELYYQPKIHAASGEVTGAEALMRWRHPQRGMVSPAVFIPIAERHGLIAALGQWMIDESCRQVRVWRDAGLRMRVAINLSAHQLRQADLAERIRAALGRHQINPDLLTCEITETAAVEDTAVTTRVLGELAAVGLHISIDDFGCGHSSLAYLRKLPARQLKIDRGFVADIEHSSDALAVVDAVIKLAHALGLKVVAEGVETENQRDILLGLRCDELQGYLFAKPMPAKMLTLWAMDDDSHEIEFRHSLFQHQFSNSVQ